MASDRRGHTLTFLLLATTVGLALAGNLATETLDIRSRWWPVAIWAGVVVLFAIAVGLEVLRIRRQRYLSVPAAASTEHAMRKVPFWRRRRATQLFRRARNGDGFDGLADLHMAVHAAAGRSRAAAGRLFDAVAELSKLTGRIDLAVERDRQLKLYEVSASGRVFPAAAHEACMEIVLQNSATALVNAHPKAVVNLLDELAIGLQMAVQRAEDPSYFLLDPAGDADVERGRLTAVVEAVARAARDASPRIAQEVEERLLAPTRDLRAMVKRQVQRYLSDEPGLPNLEFHPLVAQGYMEQTGGHEAPWGNAPT